MPHRRHPLPHVRRTGEDPAAHALGERLRDALIGRDVEAVRRAIRDGAPLAAEVQWIKSSKGAPVEWVGWLDAAVLAETRQSDGRARSDEVKSSGVVEALLDAGLHSWTALSRFPTRSWSVHPSFIALEQDAMDQLITLTATDPLMRKARAGKAVRGVVPRFAMSLPHLDLPTWLGRAAYHDRLDVVEHWLDLGAPSVQAGPCLETPWRIAWTRRFTHGSMNLPMTDRAVVDRLESHLLATASDDDWRREILGLMDLLGRSRSGDETVRYMGLHHPPSADELTTTLSRVLAVRPITLAFTDEERANRLLHHPDIQGEFALQENVLLQRTFRDLDAQPENADVANPSPRTRARL